MPECVLGIGAGMRSSLLPHAMRDRSHIAAPTYAIPSVKRERLSLTSVVRFFSSFKNSFL